MHVEGRIHCLLNDKVSYIMIPFNEETFHPVQDRQGCALF